MIMILISIQLFWIVCLLWLVRRLSIANNRMAVELDKYEDAFDGGIIGYNTEVDDGTVDVYVAFCGGKEFLLKSFDTDNEDYNERLAEELIEKLRE